jgi:hypothetical protein
LSWIASQQANGLPGCHAPCSSSSFLTAAPVSFAALHSFVPHFASFHLVRSYTFCFKAWSALLTHKTQTHAATYLFAKPTLQYSLGSIQRRPVPIPIGIVASSFQYCSVHPLPIIWLAGIPTFGCAQLANTNCSCRTSISQSIAKLRLHSSAASV